jgi:hypothetical protein
LTLTRRAIPRGSVEVTRRVVARRGLSVALLGHSVTHVRSEIAVAPFDVTLASRCQGVLAVIRQSDSASAPGHNKCSKSAIRAQMVASGQLIAP